MIINNQGHHTGQQRYNKENTIKGLVKLIMYLLYREGETCSFTSHCSFLCPSVHLSCRHSNTRRWPNVGLLLAHRLRRWTNISPVLGYCVAFDATLDVGQRHRRRANINSGPMSQHSVDRGLKVYSLKERRYRGVLCWARWSATMVANGRKRSQTIANGRKLSQTTENGRKPSQMVASLRKRSQTIANGSKR